MTDINSQEEIIYQLFIEPKGDHLLYQDEWKEQFLEEIEKEALIELYQNQEYKLIGMPFYNKVNREDIFIDKLNKVGTYKIEHNTINLAAEEDEKYKM